MTMAAYDDVVYGTVPASDASLVDPSETRVLDVGCGNGATAAFLHGRGHVVTAVTASQREADLTRQWCEAVYVTDVENWDGPRPVGLFDAIVVSHILEHLVRPQATLLALRGMLRDGGSLYVATPNVAFWKLRASLLRGQFEYSEVGIMDRSHLRFFTRASLVRLVQDSGFDVITVGANGWFPLGAVRRLLGARSQRLDRSATRWAPGFFGYEIQVVGKHRRAQPVPRRGF